LVLCDRRLRILDTIFKVVLVLVGGHSVSDAVGGAENHFHHSFVALDFLVEHMLVSAAFCVHFK